MNTAQDTKGVQNRAFCNSCEKLVPAATIEREGKVFLRKLCPGCGSTETVVSSDARTYMRKRQFDKKHDYMGCGALCAGCTVHKPTPNIVFVDLTNRCNLNCLCCIANIPAMGFKFDPPRQYFARIFQHLGAMDPRPSVQFFGGEPTVREDLFDLIQLAKGEGLHARIVTNGLKLADPDYCEKLVGTKATILIAFDGPDPEVYRILRGQSKMLKKKLKAFENLGRARKPKVVIMSLVARGLNDDHIGETLQKCHDEWPFVRSIQFIPLTHTWEEGAIEVEPERMTPEDVEAMVDAAFPGQKVEFVPAGMLELNALRDTFGGDPIPFGGVHPNCESMTLLFSSGGRFVPINRFLEGSLLGLVCALRDADEALRRRFEAPGVLDRLMGTLGLRKAYRRLVALLSAARCARRHVDLAAVLGCSRAGVPLRLLRILLGVVFTGKTSGAIGRHTALGRAMQLIVLPFEDKWTLETQRLERCRAAFAFINPDTDTVQTVPVCAWTLYSREMMRKIADKYGEYQPAAVTGAA